MHRRAVEAMADEVRRLLDDGVVREPQEVDLALITGGGYPFHLGGITPYLDRTGVSERVTGRRFLADGVANGPASAGMTANFTCSGYPADARSGYVP